MRAIENEARDAIACVRTVYAVLLMPNSQFMSIE